MPRFGEKVDEEVAFAEEVMEQLKSDGSKGGTAPHVITINCFDNGRLVFRGYEVVPRKASDPKIVEPYDIKTMIQKIIDCIGDEEYSDDEKEILLGKRESIVDLPTGVGEGRQVADGKADFFARTGAA